MSLPVLARILITGRCGSFPKRRVGCADLPGYIPRSLPAKPIRYLLRRTFLGTPRARYQEQYLVFALLGGIQIQPERQRIVQHDDPGYGQGDFSGVLGRPGRHG